jgi:predicted dehydrogenase/nucleoside-diphosphate-sugar epimerase
MTETQPDRTVAAAPAAPADGSTGRSGAGPFRVGLLGAGYIAEHHAKALRALGNTRLAAVCDRSLVRARACAETFGIPGVYASLEAMLGNEKLDAVHVLLPPEAHCQATMAILKAGVAAFLEKPMCISPAECDQLIACAQDHGVRLGVGHNFLYAPVYEQLRRDMSTGVFGPVDHVTITWHKELGQVSAGPFDLWMLREPANVMLEVGPHPIGHLLDLVGKPDAMQVTASNAVDLPSGKAFFRRWQIHAYQGKTAVDVNLSFARGYAEHQIHVRGTLCSATADFERDTYVVHRHLPYELDFDRYAMLHGEARALGAQARQTIGNYLLSKVRKSAKGNPYGYSITRAAEAFYASFGRSLDRRLSPELGREIVATCEQIGRMAAPPARPAEARRAATSDGAAKVQPSVLLLGATGFIGQELVRQMVGKGRAIRILVRGAGKVSGDLIHPLVEVVEGDCASASDLDRSLRGIECVVHLARAHVKTWQEYQEHEIGMTRLVAESALRAGVRRFLYTGTIDSYYAGAGAGTIDEQTPLDPQIHRRNLYARAKAESEQILLDMHRNQGLPLVIFRPGIVIGRGSSPFHWGIGMWQHGAVCQVWGDGRNKLPLVLVEDVASALCAGMEVPNLEGEAFNLVGDPCLSADEYLDELERVAKLRLQRLHTPISRFYGVAMLKWMAKVLVRHPEHILPSYRDWESRTQKARFDCAKAKWVLGWRPASERTDLVERGIAVPSREWLA